MSCKISAASYRKEVPQHDFCLRQPQKNCIEQKIPLCSFYIDLIKNLTLLKVLERIEFPPTFVTIIWLFHEGMTSQVNIAVKWRTPPQYVWSRVGSSHYSHQRNLHLYSIPLWSRHSIPFARLFLRTASTHSQDKSQIDLTKEALISDDRTLVTQNRIKPAADAGPLLWRLKAFRFIN